MDLRDDDLLRAWIAERDETAFRRICDRHAGPVAAACRRLGSPDADEAAQAVFLVLARRGHTVGRGCLAGWLTITARRVVANQRRTAANRRRHEHEAAMEQFRQRSDAATPTWAEARPHLDEALAGLSAGQREAIVRFFLHGKPQAEIAHELGCSVDALKNRIHVGLERLRTALARRGVMVGSAALASGLAGELAAAEPVLAATCAQTAFTPAGAPGAAAIATGVSTTMFIKTAAIACAAVLVVGSAITATLITGAETAPAVNPPTSVATSAEAERAEIDRLLDIAVQHGFPDARGATVWKGALTVKREDWPDDIRSDGMNLQLVDGSWVLLQWWGMYLEAGKGFVVDCRQASTVPVSHLLSRLSSKISPDAALVEQQLKRVAESAHLPAADAAFLSRVISQWNPSDFNFWTDKQQDIGLLHLWRIGHPDAADMMHATCISRNMYPYRTPRILSPGAPLSFRLASPNRMRIEEDVSGDAVLPAMRSTDFVRTLLMKWAVERLHLVASADRPQALATAMAVADPGQQANIRRLEASLSVPQWPAVDAPLANRLAAWMPILGGGYAFGLEITRPEFPPPPPELSQDMERLGSMIAELQHEAWSLRLRKLYDQQRTLMEPTIAAWRERRAELIAEADLDGLFALLDDTSPSRWIDRGLSRTLGDNALRALAHLMQRDPRTFIGRPVDAAWTDPERIVCARALKAWWAAHRQQGLTPILDESLAVLSLSQAFARLGIETLNTNRPIPPIKSSAFEHEQRRLATALGRCWLAKPPKAEECAPNLIPLVRFAVQMQSIPEVQKALDGLTSGWSEFQACWKHIHGDSTALEALLAAGRTGTAGAASVRRVVDALMSAGLPIPGEAPVHGDPPPAVAKPPATSDF